MKILILGYSGSGKSTLAAELSDKYEIPLLHLDRVQFLENWQEREKNEKLELVKNFLDSNRDWIIDGVYSGLFFERRLEEADLIIILNVNRLTCFLRAYKRYLKYKDKNISRPSVSDGCKEKFDIEFIKWLLWQGRSRERREAFKFIKNKYGDKVISGKGAASADKIIDILKRSIKK